MLSLISRDWWVFALRGVAAILFGIMAIASPEITLAALVLLFGAYAFVDGVALLIALARGEAGARRHAWSVGIMGVLGIVASIVTFVWPGITALSLLYIVAFWAIATGVFQTVAAVALRREIEGEFWMGLGGVMSVVFGIFLIVSPGTGLIALVWLVGFWAIVFGASSLGARLPPAWHRRHAAQAGAGALTTIMDRQRRPATQHPTRRWRLRLPRRVGDPLARLTLRPVPTGRRCSPRHPVVSPTGRRARRRPPAAHRRPDHGVRRVRCRSSTSTSLAFVAWMLVFEKSPWPTLTLVVSLEAIFLSTFVMIGQNRQAAFQQAKADHDFREQEQELKTNTELTRAIHRRTSELHERVLGTGPSAAEDSTIGPPSGGAHAP